MCTQPMALERVISTLEEAHSVLEENEGATIPEDVSLEIAHAYTTLFNLFADTHWSRIRTSAISTNTLFEHMEHQFDPTPPASEADAAMTILEATSEPSSPPPVTQRRANPGCTRGSAPSGPIPDEQAARTTSGPPGNLFGISEAEMSEGIKEIQQAFAPLHVSAQAASGPGAPSDDPRNWTQPLQWTQYPSTSHGGVQHAVAPGVRRAASGVPPSDDPQLWTCPDQWMQPSLLSRMAPARPASGFYTRVTPPRQPDVQMAPPPGLHPYSSERPTPSARQRQCRACAATIIPPALAERPPAVNHLFIEIPVPPAAPPATAERQQQAALVEILRGMPLRAQACKQSSPLPSAPTKSAKPGSYAYTAKKASNMTQLCDLQVKLGVVVFVPPVTSTPAAQASWRSKRKPVVHPDFTAGGPTCRQLLVFLGTSTIPAFDPSEMCIAITAVLRHAGSSLLTLTIT